MAIYIDGNSQIYIKFIVFLVFTYFFTWILPLFMWPGKQQLRKRWAINSRNAKRVWHMIRNCTYLDVTIPDFTKPYPCASFPDYFLLIGSRKLILQDVQYTSEDDMCTLAQEWSSPQNLVMKGGGNFKPPQKKTEKSALQRTPWKTWIRKASI